MVKLQYTCAQRNQTFGVHYILRTLKTITDLLQYMYMWDNMHNTCISKKKYINIPLSPNIKILQSTHITTWLHTTVISTKHVLQFDYSRACYNYKNMTILRYDLTHDILQYHCADWILQYVITHTTYYNVITICDYTHRVLQYEK